MRRGGCFYIAAGILLFFGIAMACNFAGDPKRWKTGVVFLAICAIPMIVLAGRALRVRLALGPIDWKIERGRATYVRAIRSGELVAAEAELVCERYRVTKFGRIWAEHTDVLFHKKLEPVVVRMNERLELRMPLEIDPQITNGVWLLRVKLRMRGAPDDESRYKLSAV